MIRVQVAVEGRLVRDAVSAAVAREPGLEVVTAVRDGEVGTDSAAAVRPDVIVLTPPVGEPPEEWVSRYQASFPGAKIVLLLISTRAEDLPRNGGADAVLDAADGLAEVVTAIRSVADERHRR